MDWTAIAVVAGICVYMAWNIGANDVANSMGVAVGSRSLTLGRAILLAGIFEFGGSVLVGADVTDTVRKGIVEPAVFQAMPEQFVLGMTCALLASALWLHAATWAGMPVSTTHSIVGAVAGFGIVAAGFGCVHWPRMAAIVLSWFISPVAGLVLAFVAFRILTRVVLARDDPVAAVVRMTPVIVFFVAVVVALATLYDGMKNLAGAGNVYVTGGGALLCSAAVGLVAALVSRLLVARYMKGKSDLSLAERLRRVERVFAPLLVVSSCSVAFAHGANDVANAVGPLAAVADVVRTGELRVSVQVPFWILALGGAGIVWGLSTYGRAVMLTVGTRITEVTPSRALAANIATAVTVLVCTRLRLPVSTSHTIVGAVLGVGLARGVGAVNGRVLRRIFISWALTVPAAAVLTVILYFVGRLAEVDVLLHGLMQAAPGSR